MNKKDNKQLPKVVSILRWFCKSDLVEDLEGDLSEIFYQRVNKKGIRIARWLFIRDIILLFRPGIIKPLFNYNSLKLNGMFKTQTKIAWRHLQRNKLVSSITILGLALAMGICFIILLYITRELSYDKFGNKTDRIFRVTYSSAQNGNFKWLASSHFPMAEKLKNAFPEIEYTARVHPLYGGVNINRQDHVFSEKNFVLADDDFFKIFNFDFVQGSSKSAFGNGKGIVITESAALKLFGNDDPLGQQFTVFHRDYKSEVFEVSGVIKDYSHHSHFNFEVIAPLSAYSDVWENWGLADNYTWSNVWTYLLIKEKADQEKINNGLNSFVENHYPPPPRSYDGASLYLQPLNKIHLHSNLAGEIKQNGDINHIYIFSIVALIILLIAIVNYANLSAARYLNRANEVRVKKVYGASKKSLIIQFLSESILQSLFALIIGFGLTYFTLPTFNSIVIDEFTLSDLLQPKLILFYFLVAIFTGIFAGVYPAFFLSSLRSIQIFKKSFKSGTRNLSLPRILVIFQFCMTMMILICVLIINNQNEFIVNKDLGFDKEQVVVLKGQQIKDHLMAFKEELLKVPDIKYVSAITSGIPGLPPDSWRFKATEISPEIPVYFSWVGYDFTKVLGIKLLEGSEFDPTFPDQSKNAVIINESAVKAFNLYPDPVGQEIYQRQFNGEFAKKRVLGVIADFNFETLYSLIKPMVFTLGGRYAVIKMQSNDVTRSLLSIESILKKFTSEPMEFYFIEDNWSFQHRKESNLNMLLKAFFIIAMLIACMGLFGITVFSVNQRAKEMAIRKVLGASLNVIMWIFSKDFLLLIMISFLLSIPGSHYIMSRWLENFAYHTSIDASPYIVAGLMVFIITIFTISVHAIKASRNDPINSLKHQV